MGKLNNKKIRLLLTGGSIIGCAAIGVCGIHDGMKARDKMYEDMSLFEADRKTKMKALWKCFIPTGVATAATIGLSIASHRVSGKQIACVTAAAAGTKQLYDKYESKLRELIPEDKLREVKQEVIKERAKEEALLSSKINKEVKGKELFYEPVSDQYFWSTREQILSAQNEINKTLIHRPNSLVENLPFIPDEEIEIAGVEFIEFLSKIDAEIPKDDWSCFGWYYGDGDGWWDHNWSYFGGPWVSVDFVEIPADDEQYGIGKPYAMLDYGPMPPYFGGPWVEDKKYQKEIREAKDRWDNEHA